MRCLMIGLLVALFSLGLLAKPLAERLLNVDDPGYNEALEELLKLDAVGKKKVSLELVKIIKSMRSGEERANAVLALGDLGQEDKTLVVPVIGALKDAYFPMRQAAISALEKIGPAEAGVVEAVIKMLEDKNEGVMAKALSAVINFGPLAKTALPRLKKLLNHKDPAIKDLAKMAVESVTQESKK